MNFDEAKENIQPLAQGRNASILQASLSAESPQELLARRKELEKEIHNYNGDDPLSVWYNYIEWIEQSFPSGGKESGLQEVLCKCLATFESEEKYRQDRRMVKLFIKFIDSHKDPAECYQQLYNAGIGTMVADFYIAWAYCYDLVGNVCKADEIFLRGIACRAEPLEDLKEARQHFGFAVGLRSMYKDDDPIREETNREMQERRMALTSLRGHRRKQMVGSLRTGSAVKSILPGTIDLPSTSSQRGNAQVKVFKDENENPNVITKPSTDSESTSEVGKSVVRSIIDTARNQENEKEPGPWNKAHSRKKGKLFAKSTITNELGFEIHEDGRDEIFENIKKPCIPPIIIPDSDIKFDKPFIYPAKFSSYSKPIKGWITPVTIEEMPEKNSIPDYNKCKLYPRPNVEFQPEELRAYNILKKRNIENEFTKEHDEYWGCGPKYNIRLYPHFAKQSRPQELDSMDQPYIPEKVPGLKVAFNEIYNIEEKVERQFEEILALRIKRNETIVKTTDMEETLCVTSEKIKRRKSFYPMRKSLAPSNFKDSHKMSLMSEHRKEETEEENDHVAVNPLPKPSSHSKGSTTAEDETNPVVLNKNSSQREGPKMYDREESCSKTIPVDSKLSCNLEEPPKLLVQKQRDTKLLATEVSQVGTRDAVSPKTFEIFKDDSSVVEIKSIKSSSQANTTATMLPNKNDFHFKTPALPIASSASVALGPNKLPFEIFDDEVLAQKSPNSSPKPDINCGGGFFDSDETCSTQTFNKFLKAQSVSTPKAITKSQPQRQIGNILKEITPHTIPEQKEEHNLTFPANSANCVVAVGYSPPRQQLSTILETSEHGTTQGTHTTGATTKSTISSPEFEIDSHVQTTTSTGGNQPPTVLETVKELSCEESVNVNKMMNSLKTLNVADINTTNTQTTEKNIDTPGAIRFKSKCAGGGLNFSIFEDSIKTDQKQVGNFSRLEQKEDTATGSVFKTLPPIRFQDDKTETIPKMFITSQHIFQDDKTETIPKMILDPQLLPSQQPVNFSEDKTENISKFMLPPTEPPLTKAEEAELVVKNREKNQQEELYPDDTFEFFGQTPPKPSKQFIIKQKEQGALSHIRTAADNLTPLTFESKRFCDKDTSEVQKMKSISKPTVLFKDKLQSHLKNVSKNFSVIEESQPVLAQSNVKHKGKSILRDSFIPDFSLIEDSPPETKRVQSVNQHSILPEFSFFKNTQPTPNSPVKSSAQNRSTLSEFFHVSARQLNETVNKSLDPVEPDYKKQSSTQQPSIQKNLSKEGIEECKAAENISQKHPANPVVLNRTQDGTSLKSILLDSFVKDFSLINEPPPRTKDVKEITLTQLTKNNSSLRFLNESLKHKSGNQQKISNATAKEATFKFLSPELPSDKSPGKENKLNSDKYFELNCDSEMFGTNISSIKNSTWLPNHEPQFHRNDKQLSQIQKNSLHIKPEQDSPNSIQTSTWLSNHGPQVLRNDKQLSQIQEKSLHKKPWLSNHGPQVLRNDKQLSQIQEKSLHMKPEQDSSNSIQNSTWLPNHGPQVLRNDKQLSQIQEKSLHMKPEQDSSSSLTKYSTAQIQQVLRTEDSSKSKQNDVNKKLLCDNDLSYEISDAELAAFKAQSFSKLKENSTVTLVSPEQNDDEEMSIYFKTTPKTPKPQVHIWDDADACQIPAQNFYIHTEPDLNQTHQTIANMCIDPNVNPFNVDLINAFLEQNYFISYLEGLPTCKLVGSIQRLMPSVTININGINFDVIKLIGEGAYGSVYCGKERSTGKLVAMKQERPPNFWEYYICLEVQERIRSDEMLRAYMSIDYAIVGNNSSVFVSNFYQYGSLITVCNKIKKSTLKNVDEYVVMLLATELLEIMDHLHAVNIIHADVKADNFLLMNKLTYPPTDRHLQLIDFGVSIDMKLFKQGQTFSFVHNDNSFKCPEMREQRPWTYQLDLFGLAGVFHVLLFGKYMDIEKNSRGFWMHKTHVPRYLNKNLWDEIFKTLLNIRDCNSMPNLQDLRALLKKEMEERDKYVLKMVNEFNRALDY